MINPQVDRLISRLEATAPVVERRDRRYRGEQPLRFVAEEVTAPDLKNFGVNICRIAVDSVAERMRVKRITARARGRDYSDRAIELWVSSSMDQLLQPLVVDALALGSAFLIVWADDDGRPTLTPESARHVAVERHPVTGAVTGAVKRWHTLDPSGAVETEQIIWYTSTAVTHFSRARAGEWVGSDPIPNPLGMVPVVPIVNTDRVGLPDDIGHSVIDDLGDLVDALSKILADMLVASEDVARPRRWATGVELEEESDDEDGFTADGGEVSADVEPRPVVSPFESGNRMFTVESPDAKFGQLPGADLQGYRTAVDLILQQIMSVSALPAHMVGVTTSNPSSADAIRAAEASLTARADSRIRVVGIALEAAIAMMVAQVAGVHPRDVVVTLRWSSTATRSAAQEADAIMKLHSEGILTKKEAREQIGLDPLSDTPDNRGDDNTTPATDTTPAGDGD